MSCLEELSDRLQALLYSLLVLLEAEQYACLGGSPPVTHNVNERQPSPGVTLTVLLLTPTPITNTQMIIIPAVLRTAAAATGIFNVPLPHNIPSPPPLPYPTPANPHTVGLLKHMAFAFPAVMPSTLLPFYDFHLDEFSLAATKDKLMNLSGIHTCQYFAAI